MNKIFRHINSCLFACLCFNSLADAAAGTSGWPIFTKIQSTQYRALSATSPGYSDLAGILYNPAIAGTLSSKQLLFISEIGFAEDRLGAAFVGLPAGKGMISFGAGYYDAGSVELNWIENGEIMTENVALQRDVLGLLSYERSLCQNLFFGMTLKGAKSEIAQRSTASAYAADFGILYLPLPNLTVSLALQNTGTSSKFVEKANPLPASEYLGMGYVWRKDKIYVLTGAGVTNNSQENLRFPEVGVELGIGNVAFNFGYSSNIEEANIHAGLKFTVNDFVIGYAYLPPVYLAPTHRVTIGYKFSGAQGAAKGQERLTCPPLTISVVEPTSHARIPMDITVAQFSVQGLPQSHASFIADNLRLELIKKGQCDVVERADMEKVLSSRYFKQPGCDTPLGATKIGEELNAKTVVIGTASKMAGKYHLRVRVIDAKTGRITRAYSALANSLKSLKSSGALLADKIMNDWIIDSTPVKPAKKLKKKSPQRGKK